MLSVLYKITNHVAKSCGGACCQSRRHRFVDLADVPQSCNAIYIDKQVNAVTLRSLLLSIGPSMRQTAYCTVRRCLHVRPFAARTEPIGGAEPAR